jgi:tRNA nucleotidyltransferase/poly(A) polymerase
MDSSTQSILSELLNFSTIRNQKLFVVGGTLRDYLSRRPCSDFDLTGKNAAELGTGFAHSLNFTCVPLDKTPGRKTVRVVLDQNRHLDFTDLQGRNIEEDLSQRDFTINAMGMFLSDFLSGRKDIIDPYKGQEDLKNRKIRVLEGAIIPSDPLRMLRAFRFAATLDFEIVEDTLSKISLHKTELNKSAPERIWHELILFFKAASTLSLLESMHGCGLLGCLFPISDEVKTITQYQRLESLLKDPGEIFPEYANKFSAHIFLNKHYLLRLSVLLKGVDQSPISETEAIESFSNTHGLNLNPSNAEIKSIDQTLNGARSLTEAYLKGSLGQNETYELTTKVHEELLASIILFTTGFSLQNKSDAENRVLFCNRMFKFYYGQFLPTMNKKPLLNGEDIIHKFCLSPSPLFGKILNCVQKAQVLGDIATREDAITLAGDLIQSKLAESE